MAMESLARPPGSSFAPEDGDLLALYLRPKIAGEPLPSTTAPYIHDLDVYAAEPAALVSGLLHASVARNGRESSDEWYFYTSVQAKSNRDSRRCRAVAGGAGTWHSEKARQEVVDQEEDRVIGYRQSFTYEPKNGWLMTEYTLVGQEGGRGEAMPVLCRIYRSPHAGAGRSASKSNSSMSGSKKRKAVAAEGERSGAAGSSGRVRRRLQFPFPPAPSPCALVAPAGSEILIPVEAQAEKKAEDEFLVPIEAQAEKKAEDEFLLPIEAQAEKKAEYEFLLPIEAQAEKKAEDEFLVPIESQQEPQLASMASSRALSIARVPMVVRRAWAGALASLGLPFEEWATEDQINSRDASPPMGGFISPYDATSELNCSHLCGFPPSALNSYGTTLGSGVWATPPSVHGLPANSWTSIY